MSRQVNLGQVVPNIQIGEVTTISQEQQASVENVGTGLNPVFNFSIPRGNTGEQGQTGPAGQDGVDGISPTASVSKSGNTATITITDKNGTTTATVKDGINGTNGRDGYVQYTAGDNITIENNVISATGGNCNLPVITLDTENGTTVDPKSISDASKVVNDAYNAGIKYTAILLRATSGVLVNGSKIAYPSRYANFDEQKTSYRFYCMAPGESYQIKLGIEFTIYGTWNNNVFTCTYVGITGGSFNSFGNYLKKDNATAFTPTGNYNPATKKYVDDNTNVNVITSSDSTYTIASLVGNTSYKLGEITALTITATTTFDKESVIYFTSGTTATSVSLPSSITNLGDVPEMTETNGVNSGICTADKSYIIAIQNNIAIWKEY